MTSAGPVELFVDTAELGRLRGELQTLQAELSDLPAHQSMTAGPDALGGDDVAGAVDRFAVHWNDARARIAENLGECLALTEGAIQAYTATESAIQHAAPAPGGPAVPDAR
jgi:hypothetical protein